MTKQATWLSAVALVVAGCAGGDTGSVAAGLTFEETQGAVTGSYVDTSEAELGQVDFRGRFVDTNVLEIVLELHGLTITSLVDFDHGVIEYDGFATDTGEDTQIVDDDRALLAALARALDTVGTDANEPLERVRSFANTWAEFPTTLDPQGQALTAEQRYSSICGSLNTYRRGTHDCNSGAGDCSDWWGCERGDDNSTIDYAYVSMHAPGPCSEGTYFWRDGQWVCYEADHPGAIEHALGACLGRCGADCGSSTQFTADCLDHDLCVRTGHDMASFWCDDEFTDTVDDWTFAPNCL